MISLIRRVKEGESYEKAIIAWKFWRGPLIPNEWGNYILSNQTAEEAGIDQFFFKVVLFGILWIKIVREHPNPWEKFTSVDYGLVSNYR